MFCIFYFLFPFFFHLCFSISQNFLDSKSCNMERILIFVSAVARSKSKPDVLCSSSAAVGYSPAIGNYGLGVVKISSRGVLLGVLKISSRGIFFVLFNSVKRFFKHLGVNALKPILTIFNVLMYCLRVTLGIMNCFDVAFMEILLLTCLITLS